MFNTSEVFIFIVLPIFLVFISICILMLIYKKCIKSNRDNDENSALLTSMQRYSNQIENERLRNFDNNMIRVEVGLADKVNYEKTVTFSKLKEAAFVYLQFFLRSNTNKGYSLIEHLETIGRNTEKNWFLINQTRFEPVKQTKIVDIKVLILYKINSNKKEKTHPFQSFQTRTNLSEMIVTNQSQVKLFNELLASLSHPYIFKYDLVDINFNESYILIVSGFSKDGSLKDLLHDSKPLYDYNKKYQYKKGGLTLPKVKQYSKQILKALLFLKSKRMPPLIDLHSGNVILANNKNKCLISGYEYLFFGASSSISTIFNRNIKKLQKYEINEVSEDFSMVQSVKEILCFGHVVYEMLVGCELEQLSPLPQDMEKIKGKFNPQDSLEIVKFINYIFFNGGVKSETKKDKIMMPNLDFIDSHPFLANIQLNEIKNDIEMNNNCQSIEMIEFIDFVIKKNKEISSRDKFKKTKLTIQNSVVTKLENPPPPATSAPPPPPPPPAPSMPPPPPPPPMMASNHAPVAIPESSGERSALLGDIRKGRALKKVQTVDKSKPKLK